jgi:uncharacterized glyoxalase superfamily protein PhnB
VVDLLVARGARHHVFSAIALGDRGVLRSVVEGDPDAIGRRLSPFEQEQTALHYVIAPPDGLVGGLFRTGEHYRTLETLLELGADVDARDARGRTPLDVAMLRGDREAMRLLYGAGARESDPLDTPVDTAPSGPSPALGESVDRCTPMLVVPDMEAAIAWYRSIGFELAGCHGEGGRMDWASMTFGSSEIMFVPSPGLGRPTTSGLSLWFSTDRLDDLYSVLKERQLDHARATLAGDPMDGPEIRFTHDLYTAFYGQREFGIVDPNGIELMFAQPVE